MSGIPFVLLMIGLQSILIGFLINKFIADKMIAGYDSDDNIDKKGMANWAGSNLIYMGLACMIGGGVTILLSSYSIIIMWTVIIGVIPVFCLRIIMGMKKYENKKE